MASPDLNSPGVSNLVFFAAALAVGGAIIGGGYLWSVYQDRQNTEESRLNIVKSGLPADFFDAGGSNDPVAAPPVEESASEPEKQAEPEPQPQPQKTRQPKPEPKPTARDLFVEVSASSAIGERASVGRARPAVAERRRGSARVVRAQAGGFGSAQEDVRRTDAWNREETTAEEPVDMTRTVTEDRFIRAIIIPAVNSELGGKVVAQVEEHVYGAEGRKILIPAGSRAVGRYQPTQRIGEERIAITWHRIITPEGIDIDTRDAEAADHMGRSGVTGEVDSRYDERYGLSLLVSTLSAVTQLQVTADSQDEAVVVNNYGGELTSLSNTILQEHINIKPRILLQPGRRILISPRRDIRFETVNEGIRLVPTG